MIKYYKSKKRLQYSFLFFILISFLFPLTSYSQANGEKIFITTCRSCHTIGQGRLVGPDLANIQNRLETDWIIKFIKSSQSLVKSGDPEAVKIFNEYNKIIMPDQALSNDQILSVINYIKEKSPKETATKAAEPPPFKLENSLGFNLNEAGKDEANIGQKYFTGEKRFAKGGPSCVSCHNVVNDNIIGGGKLSKDLTKAFSRLNATGIDAIISNPPFPAMRTAFNDKKLTEDERYYLLAFLKAADKDAIYQHPVNYNDRFLYSGIAGVIILLGFFGLAWFGRKKGTVNKEIFKRQFKSK